MELIDRIEAAEKGSRELDAEIAVAVRYFPKNVGFVWKDSLTPNSPEVGRVECCTKLGTGGPHYAAPVYSTSLDAAMSLATPDMDPLDILQEALETARAARDNVYFLPVHICAAALEKARTARDGMYFLPLHICAAMLKARQ